ncbi:hypothetical protein V8E54_007380 [Elaphomyces granulatus]
MPSASVGDGRRHLSLPHSGFRGSPRSPSTKKHRCPFCSTEFTRHHNLKSHLLTHSQEKPYVCQTCQSRFRRLHDLKRHTKLHTGERPHICPQCGRRFARGDALARHNKGQGGCAGRRSSMGSYAGEDDYGEGGATGGPEEDAMDGLMYTEPERMDEEDERRMSMPSIRKHSAPRDGLGRGSSSTTGGTYPHRTPSTYPPIASNRPSPGGLFPPATSHGGSSSSTSPISQTGAFPSSAYPTASMTESPKPLSPNPLPAADHGPEGSNHRAHSPSRGSQYPPPSHYGRAGPPATQATPTGKPGAVAPPHPPPPPPHPSSLGLPPLPPPPGLNPSDPRLASPATFPTTTPGTASRTHPGNHGPPGPPTANIEAGGSHYAGPSDSNSAPESAELWKHFLSMQEEVKALRTEMGVLKAQMTAQNVPNQPQYSPPTARAGGGQ